jgi:hypothetical protein
LLYAVVKHRVLEIPVLLKPSARYVLVQRGYFVFRCAVAAIAIALFTLDDFSLLPGRQQHGHGLEHGVWDCACVGIGADGEAWHGTD